MSVTLCEVQEHYQSVSLAEAQYLRENEAVFNQASAAITPLAETIDQYQYEADLLSVYPRLSLKLMSRVFSTLHYAKFLDPVYPESLQSTHALVMSMSGIASNPSRSVMSHSNAVVSTCGSAERYFIDTLSQIVADKPKKAAKQAVVNVYCDASGNPLILQKDFEERSGLTLQTTEVNGIEIPAGCLVAVQGGKLSGEYKQGSYRMRSFEPTPRLAINPRRLSVWAYNDPLDRGLFGLIPSMPDEFRAERIELLTSYQLDDFTQAARKIMEQCQIKISPVAASVNA